MGAIQFRGKDAVLDAYRFNNVGPWAICIGKEMPFSCEESDMAVASGLLDECLDRLKECLSNADYSLKVFRHVPATGIVSTTPYANSFRFRLLTDEEYEGGSHFGKFSRALNDRLEAIERRLEEPDDLEPERPTIGDSMAGMFNRPEVQQFILGKIFGLVNQIFPNQKAQPAAMAGVNPMDTTMQQTTYVKTAADLFGALSDEERERFDKAVYVLLGDPHIGTHLGKLAAIFEEDPDRYAMLCKMA
jgi:hypothetical protein